MDGKSFAFGVLAGVIGVVLLLAMKGVLFVVLVIAALLLLALIWGKRNDSPPS